jgi:hypothetical protein
VTDAPRAPKSGPGSQVASFEQAWSRIGETYPDPAMHGLDWSGVHAELLPRARAARTARELRPVIEDMLGRLGESHYVLIPGETYGEEEPPEPSHGKAAEAVPAGAPGDLGLDVRVLGDELVVTRVEPEGAAGIAGVLLFGLPESKDAQGSGAWEADGIVQRAIRGLRSDGSTLVVVADVCLCEYTDHGHCGVLEGGRVANDPTLELLGRTAMSQVEAGADVVAPSAMMDGQVAAIRRALDAEGREDTPIMAYAAKYASSFFGPFREAADSAPRCSSLAPMARNSPRSAPPKMP